MAELSQFKLTLTEAPDNGIKVEAAFETPDGVIYEQSDEDGAFAVNVQIPPKWYHTAFWFFFVPYWQFTGQTIDE